MARAASATSRRAASPAPARQILGPIVHEPLPPLEQVRPGVGGLDMAIGLPLRIGNASGLQSPSTRAASSISNARPQSGTRCSRFAFIRMAETVHTRSAALISARPCGEPDFGRLRGREHEELERQLDGGLPGLRRPHWRTALAVSALTCQIGVRISSTSAVLTSETGRLPMRGKA